MLLYGSLVPLALSWLIDGILSQSNISAFESPAKILVAIVALVFLANRPPRPMFLWFGTSIGVIAGCAEAAYQVFVLGHPRASGGIYIIHFGNLALMMGLLGLCAWNVPVRRPWTFRAWLTLSAAAGVLASILSGTRGGWFAMPFVLLGYGVYLLARAHYRQVGLLAGLVLLALSIILTQPGLKVRERVEVAQAEVSQYASHGIANTSVGARLQMWRQALKLYRERPVLGWQQRGYLEQQKLGIERGELDPLLAEFGHPHNDWLNAASKQGTVGLLTLLLAYLGPLWIFASWFRSATSESLRAATAAGMLIPICYFAFGLTESFLIRTAGITTYVYMLCLLWGTSWGLSERTSKPDLPS